MRVSQLLKQLNIGLPTLNEEMACLQLPSFEINSKLSDEDSKFLIDYFNSEEMQAINSAKLEILRCRRRLNQFFLGDKKPIEQLGMMEKSLYFKWIINFGENYVSFRNRFPFVSSYGYSEETFVKLYDWYFHGLEKMNKKESQLKLKPKRKEIKRRHFQSLKRVLMKNQ